MIVVVVIPIILIVVLITLVISVIIIGIYFWTKKTKQESLGQIDKSSTQHPSQSTEIHNIYQKDHTAQDQGIDKSSFQDTDVYEDMSSY